MHLGHGSWVTLVIFGALFAMRYFSTQRRRGRQQAPGSQSSFTGPGHRPPPPTDSPTDSPIDQPSGPRQAHGTGTGTAPGWFRDPFFKHEHRYWSGAQWTDHVDDGGVPGTDPPPAPPTAGG